jgi:hypothetical protein
MPGPKARRLPASVAKRLPPIEDCESPLLSALWALKAAKLSRRHPDFIGIDAISEILLQFDVSMTPLRLHRGLARAGTAVARRGHGDGTEFRIVGLGERMLEERAGHQGPLAVHVTGRAPWSDRRFVVKEAASKATGDVRILDKYFGMESLDFLQDFEKKRRIEFLTTHPAENLGYLQREVARFKKEFPNSEFKAYPLPHELHDRYVLFDEEVWFVGHGIKDIGAKESFVVILQDPFGKDIRKTLHDSFEARWAQSQGF